MMRHERSAWAGLMDSGFASLASFATGIAAVGMLAPDLLGAYALAFAALNLVAVVPAQLVLVPAEARLTDLELPDRIASLRETLRLAGPIAVVAALAIPAWLPLAPHVSLRDGIALTLTAMACAVVSPLQDHLRRVIHSGGRSWLAASLSALHFFATLLSIVLLKASGIGGAWVPFGALVIGNTASVLLGLAVVRPAMRSAGAPQMLVPELVRSGRWLLATALLPPATSFIVSIVVVRLAGAAALGAAEAARLATHPIFVLAIGLSAVWAPRSMTAVRARRLVDGNAIIKRFSLLLGAFTIGYTLVFGINWKLNPLVHVFAPAYAIPGLVAAMSIATGVTALLLPQRSELIAAQHGTRLLSAELWGTGARLAAAFTAAATHVFAIPLGIIAFTAVRWPLYRRARQSCYRQDIRVKDESGALLAARGHW